jgi:hypothetical protein
MTGVVSSVITTPTVLVLGAGASAPYGFPVATELKQKICSELAQGSAAVRQLHEQSGISLGDFSIFRDAFYKSGQPSVDAFLEHRPEFIEVGKLAIAYCLIPYEVESTLFEGSKSRDWYQYLSTKLNASFDRFGENNLSVITFNYDRSLEHYLLTTLQNAHGRSREECTTALRKIRIVHVYGQLGRHAYAEREARPYNPDNRTYNRAVHAAEGITLLHDKIKPELEAAHQALRDAERVCFLGFGYHDLNLQRLNLSDSSHNRNIFGSAQGFVGDEFGAIKTALHQAMKCSNVTLTDADNLLVLRKHLILG